MEKKSVTSQRNAAAIGGIRGGSGKTIVSIGIIKSLLLRGISVAPFKKGPDYIDPAWLTLASGSQCYNLDTFLMDEITIIEKLRTMNRHAAFAVIEGNRGIFDGYDLEGAHSFSELVKLAKVPLILVVDCAKSSRTVAAVVRGCETFDGDLPLKGVILNRLGGERHKKLVTRAIEEYCLTPVLGAIPTIASLEILERHLGLMPVYEHDDPAELISAIGDAIGDNVDIDALINIATSHSHNEQGPSDSGTVYEIRDSTNGRSTGDKPVIGIIKDSAFNFYYDDNIRELKRCGATIVEISSIEDATVPDIDALYIGGGFPETHAERISRNKTFRHELRDLIDRGLPVYAECGGLVYLSKSLHTDHRHEMVGILPFEFEVAKKPMGHGYTIFVVDQENPYYAKGSVVKGHEFRYSRITNREALKGTTTVFRMQRGNGIAAGRDGLVYKNVLATFSHTHAAGDNVSWLKSLVDLAVERKKNNGQA
jgi:cobyrinic acid a,c-diamide synthase